MDKQRKQEITEAYKERKSRAGVFRVDCAGEIWLGMSRNLDAQQNSVWFSLRQGSGRNKAMQAAWSAHGEAGFAFGVVEVVSAEDLSPYLLDQALKARLAHWRAELGAGAVIG